MYLTAMVRIATTVNPLAKSDRKPPIEKNQKAPYENKADIVAKPSVTSAGIEKALNLAVPYVNGSPISIPVLRALNSVLTPIAVQSIKAMATSNSTPLRTPESSAFIANLLSNYWFGIVPCFSFLKSAVRKLINTRMKTNVPARLQVTKNRIASGLISTLPLFAKYIVNKFITMSTVIASATPKTETVFLFMYFSKPDLIV
jgi:hypothetical protein